MTRSLHLLSFAVLAVAAFAVPALARPTRIALAPIEGDTSGLGKAVAGALDDSELEVVAGTPVTRAIDRLGLDEALADRDVGKLAAELEVDAVVKAAFDRRGHRLRFTVFTGGKKTRSFNVLVGNADSDKFRKLVRKTMEAKVASAVPAKGKGKADDAADGDDAAEPADKPAGKSAKHKAKQAEDADDPLADKSAKHKAKPADEVAEASDKPAKRKAKQAEDAPADDPPAKRKAKQADEAPAHDAAAAKPADEAAPAARRVAARDDDDDAPAAAATGLRAEAELPAPLATHSANLAALRVDLGASMAGRSLKFQSAAVADAPKSYKNAPVPGARVAAELYPFAFRDPGSLLAGLGVAAAYDQTIALTLRASDEMTVPMKITERHYSFGARFRYAFGHRPTSPTLTVGIGYGAQKFAVDRSGLMAATSLDLPDVDYRMIDPGLAFRLPLGTRVAVTLAGQALLVTAAGPIQRADQYGKTSILGGAASAGLELLVADRIAVRIAAEATQLALSFAGTGTLSNGRDGDSTTVDVHGATDRYYGGVATIAVTY